MTVHNIEPPVPAYSRDDSPTIGNAPGIRVVEKLPTPASAQILAGTGDLPGSGQQTERHVRDMVKEAEQRTSHSSQGADPAPWDDWNDDD